ncbi:Pol polyprotein [Plakobranchus ocellatus]|uniref:Pol polyprotein n=1 Tax=Plakobranchus ocellatus TaxID=259542 RepID=A0AAV3YXZ7_9GAST|nr:Pol polyprotein [Plakobranchus ocellatus]
MAIDSVALKFPTFWVSSLLAWFAQAGAQFELRKITQDDTRYYHVVASLDTDTAKRALPIITAPPLTEKYKAIKDFLTSAYGLSDEERVTALLSMNGLGDNKPSELMDNMLSLLGQHQPCFLFKQIFVQQCQIMSALPCQCQPFPIIELLPVRQINFSSLAGWTKKVSTGKRQGGPTVASTTVGPPDPQLIITDSITGRYFLVETGAQVSVIPPTWHERHFGQRGQALQAANGTTISTFGSRDVKLRFHGTTYEARLIIVDVKRLLLGADFFRRHNLLVDLNGQRLIEADSYLSSPCSTSRVIKTELAPIERDCNKFRKVLQEFPALLQPTFSSESVRHGFQHYIATSGPPVHSRARRLAPDKLAAAKKEFFEMKKWV